MFDRIFADYLMEKGKLTQQDVEIVFSAKEERRARLGVIAVSEKLITVGQAEEINQLQAVQDKRFGDIAIENGYLTQEQLENLLSLQGNAFLTFTQSVIDNGYLTMEEINQALADYQQENALSDADMEKIKSCETDNIIPIFLSGQPQLLTELCGVLIRCVCRLVDYRAYIKKPYVAANITYPHAAIQELFGDYSILHVLSGDENALKQAAIGFAGAEFINDVDDSLDALCELINCVNGMFASRKSQENVALDMKVPEYRVGEGTLEGSSMLCIPIVIFDKEILATLCLNK